MPKHRKQASSTAGPGRSRIAPQRHGDKNVGVVGRKERKMHQYSRLSLSATSVSASASAARLIGAKKKMMKMKKSADGKGNNVTEQVQGQVNIPFGERDRILLVGEGDFSFARSLAEHHRCRNILATCYDTQDALLAKYPQAEENINVFLRASSDCKMGHGASSSSSDQHQQEEAMNKVENEETEPAIERIVSKCNEQKAKEENGEAKTAPSYPPDNNTVLQHSQTTPPNPAPRVLFSIDGRKLGTAAGGGKKVRNGFPPPRRRKVWHRQAPKNQDDDNNNNNSKNNRRNVSANGGGGPWDIICFNFPHVGGLSTDVNRQVRANQELLVAFFDACLPLLAVSAPVKLDGDDSGNDYTESDDDDDVDDDDIDPTVESNAGNCRARTGRAGSKAGSGQILVTLFEGEPYTLWNIRDLARHAGLRVVTSFRFPWKSYPGYSHARTLGVIENRRGEPSGWRGQDREARMYVFEAKGASHEPPVAKTGKKRPRREESADCSSE